MFKNMKVGLRLSLGFGVVLVLMMVAISVGMSQLSTLNEITDKIVTKDAQKVSLANAAVGIANDNARANMELFLVSDKREIAAILERIENNKKTITEKMDKLDELLYLPEGKALMAKIKESRKLYVTSFTRAAKLLLDDGKREEATSVMVSETLPALKLFIAAIDELVQLQSRIMDKSGQEAADGYINGRNMMVGLGIFAMLVGIAFAVWVTRSITVPLNLAVNASNSLAEGDLTVKLEATSRDETGMLLAAMKHMTEKLTQIITEVRSAADNLSSASEEVSATAQSLSQGSSEQAASVEETSASIEQMSASITQNAENAKVTDGMASKAAREATEGGEAVNQTVSAMKQIAGKIGIIDDIAYQTNLLALNAAIEAARAGEHGKGFAVVAAEVRKLAERSQVAAQEIGELAGSSVGLAEQAGKLLDEIVPSITKTSELVQEIAASSDEQSSGVGQINTAMSQVSQATQQNASASEELAATAEEMGSQAEQLQQLMDFFKLEGHAAQTGGVRQAVKVPSPAKKAVRGTAAAAPSHEKAEFVKF